MSSLAINSFIGGALTAATIGYCAFNPTPIITPQSTHNLMQNDYAILKSVVEQQIYKPFTQNDILKNEIEIIHSFVNNLIENSEKSPPHFSKTIDDFFWDLA